MRAASPLLAEPHPDLPGTTIFEARPSRAQRQYRSMRMFNGGRHPKREMNGGMN